MEPENTYSTSSPFIHSLFNMYLYLEAINLLLKTKNNMDGEPRRTIENHREP